MNQALAEEYLDYLEPQIGAEREEYRDLMRLMHVKEFVCLVYNDDNRLVDGMDVRAEWFAHRGRVVDMGPCSFLEVLIGLSRRMAFFTGEGAEGWAWQLLTNLDLERMRDPLSGYKSRKTAEILEAVIWRTYESDGTGGFFPLAHPQEDQRKVELWYQMNAYVMEIHPEY